MATLVKINERIINIDLVTEINFNPETSDLRLEYLNGKFSVFRGAEAEAINKYLETMSHKIIVKDY